MKKPTGKDKGKQQQPSKNVKKAEVEVEDESLHLVVDSNDTYLDQTNTVYFHPQRLHQVQHFENKIFDSCTIRNSNPDLLYSKNLVRILQKMKVGADFTCIVSNPLSVMQSFEAKQIEANAKIAGFDKTDILDHDNGKTLKVVGVRPERNPNSVEVEIEIQTTTTTKTDKKGNRSSKVETKVKGR